MQTIKTPILLMLTSLLLLCSGCRKFMLFDVSVPEDRNPLINKKTPTTKADLYFLDKHLATEEDHGPVVEGTLPNPDPDGAFADWATCLVMIKEGHDHGQGKLHGNYVYPNEPWKQEQFCVIHNTPDGIRVEMDRESTATFLELEAAKERGQALDTVGPEYFRIIGGTKKLWGLCLYFYDKKGNPINDKIYNGSEEYQLFFSVSDRDDKGQPYDVMDVRFRNGLSPEEMTMIDRPMVLDERAFSEEKPVPAALFAGAKSLEERRKLTRPYIFTYTYRDTWTQDDMADGVRTLYNIRLLPPLIRSQYYLASLPQDQDYVGLKGHLEFDFQDEGADYRQWPLARSKPHMGGGVKYERGSYLQPQFYLAVQVMKCEKGKKRVIPADKDAEHARNGKAPHNDFVCADFDDLRPESGWQEIIRINIPMKQYATVFDSDPTDPDPNEPYYFQLGREIGLKPQEAYEAVSNLKTHGVTGTGGNGYGSWFL